MSEHLLATLFASTAAAERRAEESRQRLAASPSFSPYAAFDQLDTKQRKKLSVTDFQSFLLESDESVDLEDLELLIGQYDSLEDSSLTLSDFCAIVLPAENISLRETAELRRRGTPGKLAKHINLECTLLRELQEAKQPFSNIPEDAFDFVDTHKYGAISIDQLRNFLRKHGFLAKQEDLQRILRRIDTDNDLRISFEDFNYFLSGCKSSASPFASTLNSNHLDFKDKNTHPLAKTIHLQSPSEPVRVIRSSMDNRGHNIISLAIPNRPNKRNRSMNLNVSSYSDSKSCKEGEDSSPSLSNNKLQEFLNSKNTPVIRKQSSELYINKDERHRSALGARPSSIHENPFNAKERAAMIKAGNMRTVKKVVRPSRKQLREYLQISHQTELPSDRSDNEFYKTNFDHYHNSSFTDASPSMSPNIGLFSTTNRRKVHSYGQFEYLRPSCTTHFQSWRMPHIEKFRCNDQGVEKLIKAMKFQAKLQERFEEIKKKVTQNSDTSLFELLSESESDATSNRCLFPKDLGSFLDRLGIYHTSSDIYLLIRKYSSFKDSKLCYSDFENMLSPFVNRSALNIGIKALIETLREFENIRKELFVNSYLNFLELFRTLDGNNDGFLNVNDLSDYLERSEANAIVKIYDKNSDGYICYSEFIQELTPKLNR